MQLKALTDNMVEMRIDGVCRATRLTALTSYLKALPSAEVAPSSVGSVVVDDSVVKLIEEEVVQNNVSAAYNFLKNSLLSITLR